MPDWEIASLRKLTLSEATALKKRLAAEVQDGSAEDVNDLLEYALAMVSNQKSVSYIVQELVGMEMDFLPQEAADKLGNVVADYLGQLDSGSGGGNALTMAGALGAPRKGESKPPQDKKKKEPKEGSKQQGDGKKRKNDRHSRAFDRLSRGGGRNGRGGGRDGRGRGGRGDRRRPRSDFEEADFVPAEKRRRYHDDYYYDDGYGGGYDQGYGGYNEGGYGGGRGRGFRGGRGGRGGRGFRGRGRFPDRGPPTADEEGNEPTEDGAGEGGEGGEGRGGYSYRGGGRGYAPFRGRGRGRGRGRSFPGRREQVATMLASKQWVRKKESDTGAGGQDAGGDVVGEES